MRTVSVAPIPTTVVLVIQLQRASQTGSHELASAMGSMSQTTRRVGTKGFPERSERKEGEKPPELVWLGDRRLKRSTGNGVPCRRSQSLALYLTAWDFRNCTLIGRLATAHQILPIDCHLTPQLERTALSSPIISSSGHRGNYVKVDRLFKSHSTGTPLYQVPTHSSQLVPTYLPILLY